MGPFQTIDDVISLILRRRWPILAVTVLGLALSLGYARARPALFETSAVIQVAGPAVSGPELPPELPAASAEMLQLTEQQLMTGENLAAGIDRHQLFADQPNLTAEEKDAALRRAIRFETIARATGSGPSNTLSAIRITATLDSADLAARVANDFAQSILDDSTAAQLTKTAETAVSYTHLDVYKRQPLGAYFPRALFDTPFGYEEFAGKDGLIGHAGLTVFDESADMLKQARFAMEFCAIESCGKCTPCRIGAVRGVETVDRIAKGDASAIPLLTDLCNTCLLYTSRCV